MVFNRGINDAQVASQKCSAQFDREFFNCVSIVAKTFAKSPRFAGAVTTQVRHQSPDFLTPPARQVNDFKDLRCFLG